MPLRWQSHASVIPTATPGQHRAGRRGPVEPRFPNNAKTLKTDLDVLKFVCSRMRSSGAASAKRLHAKPGTPWAAYGCASGGYLSSAASFARALASFLSAACRKAALFRK